MRGTNTFIPAGTLPNIRRAIRYTTFINRPFGFSMGGRYAAMEVGLLSGARCPRSAGYLYDTWQRKDVTDLEQSVLAEVSISPR
jgi:hypothetical protein